MKTKVDLRLFFHFFIALMFSYYSIFKRDEYEYSWLLIAVAVMSFIWVTISIINNVKQTGVFYKKKLWNRDDFKKTQQKKG